MLYTIDKPNWVGQVIDRLTSNENDSNKFIENHGVTLYDELVSLRESIAVAEDVYSYFGCKVTINATADQMFALRNFRDFIRTEGFEK